jgi:hypothetical protein
MTTSRGAGNARHRGDDVVRKRAVKLRALGELPRVIRANEPAAEVCRLYGQFRYLRRCKQSVRARA